MSRKKDEQILASLLPKLDDDQLEFIRLMAQMHAGLKACNNLIIEHGLEKQLVEKIKTEFPMALA